MKVKEYLVNRILKLEEELKQARNEKAGTVFGLQKLQEDVIKLNEKIEQYQIEREHIKEIISCNIKHDQSDVHYIDLDEYENDYKTLIAILDIKLDDYEDVKPKCEQCVFQDVDSGKFPCNSCDNNLMFAEKEVTPDAETTD